MNMLGLLLGVSILAAGVLMYSRMAAIRGSFVSAVVSAQRAFPFGSRAQFYRMLLGQNGNLRIQVEKGLLSK